MMALGSQLHVLTQPIQDAAALRAAVKASSPAIRAAVSANSRAPCARWPTTFARRSSCIFSATCRNPPCPPTFRELALPANVTLVLHPVAKEPPPNWAVESVNAPGQVWDPKKARVQAVIAGYHTPAATRTVSLVVNGKTVATKTVARAGRTAAPPSNSIRSTCPTVSAAAKCASILPTRFPRDDASLFAVERSDPRNVLFRARSELTRARRSISAPRSALAAESAFTLESVRR